MLKFICLFLSILTIAITSPDVTHSTCMGNKSHKHSSDKDHELNNKMHKEESSVKQVASSHPCHSETTDHQSEKKSKSKDSKDHCEGCAMACCHLSLESHAFTVYSFIRTEYISTKFLTYQPVKVKNYSSSLFRPPIA